MSLLHAVPAQRPRAVAYIRVSRERDDMTSPELQLTAIRDYCDRMHYELVEVLEDLDKSGRFWKRRQVERAISMIETGEADVVVVWKISRVARDPRRLDWNIAVDRVETVGGRLESATEPIDASTSSGRFARGVLAELAAFESERIGETWNETHQRRWRNGLPHDSRPRFGYAYEKGFGFRLDPETAPIVAELYARYIAGDTFQRLIAWLRPFQLGRFTNRKALSDFMDAGFAAGLIIHHDPKCTLPHPRDRRYRCRNTVRDPGKHDPIITREQFAEYEAARKARATIPPRISEPAFTYTGIVFCLGCSRRYVHSRSSDHGRPVDQYRCGNVDCEQRRTIAGSRLEAAVLAWLPSVASDVNEAAGRAETSDTLRRVERERVERVALEADRALVQLSKDFARRLIPEAAFITARDELEREHREATARAAELSDSKARTAARRQAAADLLADWRDMTEPERNSVLRSLCVVYITPVKGASEPKVWPAWNKPPLPGRKRPI